MKDRLKLASYIIKGYKTNEFYKIYPFTTENLNAYLTKYDFTNKRVLTVGSSGDQILNTFLMGAKDITVFDINPFTEYYFYLKSSGIETLSYNEFINFFCLYKNVIFKNKDVFKKDIFYKLFDVMDNHIVDFWKYLIDNFNTLQIRKNLFNNDEEDINTIKRLNTYLSEENYYYLKSNIKSLKPTFITDNIKYLDKHLIGIYDYIILSNISSYIEKIYKHPLKDFKENINKFENYMDNNSTLFMAYLYDMHELTKVKKHWDIIYQLDLVKKVFKDKNLEMITFEGIEENSKDSLLILKK